MRQKHLVKTEDKLITLKRCEIEDEQFSLKHSSVGYLKSWTEGYLCRKHPGLRANCRLRKDSS